MLRLASLSNVPANVGSEIECKKVIWLDLTVF